MTGRAVSWQQQAKCRGADTERWFNIGRAVHATATARALCQGCPVITECLDYALSFPATEDAHGVFGGTTPAAGGAHRPARQTA